MRTRRIAIAILSAVCAASATRAQEARPFEHQGVVRQVIVANAPAGGEAPRPALIVLHGRREASELHRSSPALDALARREGFAAVYPAALEGAWNFTGRTTSPSGASSQTADDVGFLVRLIDRLIAERIGDPRRIYVSGTSSGGFMTYSLMCHESQRIAAASVLIANMTGTQLAGCVPMRAVPLLLIAGTADKIVPYDGLERPEGRIASVAETLAYWRSRHGCGQDASTTLPHRVETDPTRAVAIAWSGCKLDGALRHIRIEGGGHILPSLTAASAATEERWGRRNQDLETSLEVWEFVRRFRLE